MSKRSEYLSNLRRHLPSGFDVFNSYFEIAIEIPGGNMDYQCQLWEIEMLRTIHGKHNSVYRLYQIYRDAWKEGQWSDEWRLLKIHDFAALLWSWVGSGLVEEHGIRVIDDPDNSKSIVSYP